MEGALDPLALAALTGIQGQAQPLGFPRPARPAQAGGHPRWPLLAVLAVQAALSLRLVWSNTAFQDEALYLRAGHLEWARWLHRRRSRTFPPTSPGRPSSTRRSGPWRTASAAWPPPASFRCASCSGSPACCGPRPPGCTASGPALLAAALFATLAGTQFLGALATFDAMALFLLALAAWLGVRSAGLPVRPRTALLITAGLTLAAADAVKYATALFTPVVLSSWPWQYGGEHGGGAGLAALSDRAVLLGHAGRRSHRAGGRDYWLGITTSTLARPQSDVPVTTVLQQRIRMDQPDSRSSAVLGAVLASRSKTSAGNSCPPS